MKKVSITTSGKIFLGTIILVILLVVFGSYLQPSSNKLMTNIYCIPNCSAQQAVIGLPTLVKSCYISQSECQSFRMNQSINNARIVIGFKDSIHKVQGIGTVTMLNLNLSQIYLRENNQTDWINVFDGSKNFDIASLQNQTAIVADRSVPMKTYTQEKIIFETGQIKVYSITFSLYNNTYALYPQTNETVLSYNFSTDQAISTYLIFDLSVENSIKHTADGYMLIPQFTVSYSNIPLGQQPANSIIIS